jgi:hypothetical protein
MALYDQKLGDGVGDFSPNLQVQMKPLQETSEVKDASIWETRAYAWMKNRGRGQTLSLTRSMQNVCLRPSPQFLSVLLMRWLLEWRWECGRYEEQEYLRPGTEASKAVNYYGQDRGTSHLSSDAFRLRKDW